MGHHQRNYTPSSSQNNTKLMNMYGEIEYHDRGGKKHTIYFYLSEWFDPNIDIYQGLSVEFNILSSSTPRAVRIRPLELPLTKEERLLKKQQKIQKENEQRERDRIQREQRQQEIRQKMLTQHQQQQQQNHDKQQRRNQGRKPPVLRGQHNIQSINIPN